MRAVNLIPGEQGRSSSSLMGRSGGAALIVVGLVAGLAILAVLYGLADRQIAKQTGEVASIESQANELKARAGRLTPYTSFVSMAEQRTKTVAQLVQARFDWSHMLRELGRVLPSGTVLATMNGTVGSGPPGSSTATATATPTATTTSSGGTPSSSTPPGSTPGLALAGCATSQSVVAQMLQRLKLIDGVQEVQLQSSTKSGSASAGGSGSSGGACGAGGPTFSVTVTFANLPSTPIPNVTTTTTTTAAAASTASKGGHHEQVSTAPKGGTR